MTLKILQGSLPGWGTTFQPPGEGPFPAVLMLHGSEGSWSLHSYMGATLLAAHGFMVLPFGYSVRGTPWIAGDIRDVRVDRTAEAVAALRAADRANGKVGLYGLSRGAEHALLLASLMARDGMVGAPEAIAVLSPPDVVVGAFLAASERDKGDAGWTIYDHAARAWTWRGSSEKLLPTTPIEIERYDGSVLLAQGTEDDVFSPEMTRRLEKRLKAHGRSPEVHWYEGQGHGAWGETANLHWEQVIAFFRRHLAASP